MDLQDDEDDEDEDEEDEEPAQKQQNCNFGYKFRPTDYDLIVHYLIKKILDQPLPCNRVVDDENELLYRCPPERIAGSSSSSSCSILNMNIRSLASSHIM